MRGRVMLRSGSLLVIKNEIRDYSIVEATREQADLEDILDWEKCNCDVTCLNETRGTSFVAHFKDCTAAQAEMRGWLTAPRN